MTKRTNAKPIKASASNNSPATIQRPYTRQEVAQLLGRTVWAVDFYVRLGKLQKAYRTNSRRSIGYTAASVRKLVEGRVR